MDSLIELLSTRAASSTVDSGYTFLDSECEPYARLSYRDLHRKAVRSAQALRKKYPSGERVALLCPQGPTFIEAFFSCIYADLIPVPVATTGRSVAVEQRLTAIAKVADLRFAIVSATSPEEASTAHLADLLSRHVSIIDLDDKTTAGEEEIWTRPSCPTTPIAFLQFTSGSTSEPRGVMVTHANVMANQQMIQEAFQTGKSDRVLSWLPPYHDMGLIGGILHPLYLDADCFLMSPLHFARGPKRWLHAISRYDITVSGAPNSAFRICSTLPQDRNASDVPIDLSSWRIAFCGAEPVRQKDLDKFCSRFQGEGFRRGSFRVCYGLAEATLIVSCGSLPVPSPERRPPPPSTGSDTRREIDGEPVVSCGNILGTQDVRIVSPRTKTEMPDGDIGEILIAGANVALGYWGDADYTSQTFSAEIANKPDRYLRTGDLGFMIRTELFVTGRIKDLLIIGGVNVHPQDVEFRALDLLPSELSGGIAAAFQEYDDGVTLAIEVSRHDQRNLAPVASTLIRKLYSASSYPIRRLILIRRGSMPRTTSGKVQRTAAKRKFAHPTSEIIFEANPSQSDPQIAESLWDPSDRDSVARTVRDILSSSLAPTQRLDGQDLGLPLVNLGIDSLRAADISARLASHLGISINPALILDCPSFDEFVSAVQRQLGENSPPQRALSATLDADIHEFTPDQLRLWFVEQTSPYPGSLIFQVGLDSRHIAAPEMFRAIAAAQHSHPILHSNVTHERGTPRFRIFKNGSPKVDVIDLTGFETRSGLDPVIRNSVRAHLRPFNFTTEHLWRLQLILLPDDSSLVVLSIHHLIADAHSAEILLDSVASPAGAGHVPWRASTAFSGYMRNKESNPPDRLALDFWQTALEIPSNHRSSGRRTPVDPPISRESRVTIDDPLLRMSLISAREHKTTLFCILLAAWQLLQSLVLDQSLVVTAVPLMGRPLPEHRDTIGPFAHPVPIWTAVENTMTSTEFVAIVHQRLLSFQRFSYCSLADAIEHDPSIGSHAHQLHYDGIFTAIDCRDFFARHKEFTLNTTYPRMFMPDFTTSGLFAHADGVLRGIIHSRWATYPYRELSWSGDDYPKVLSWLTSTGDTPIAHMRKAIEQTWTS